MKIQYCSDLHLGMDTNVNFLDKNKLIPSADILVVAGDVGMISRMGTYSYMDLLASSFKQVYIIPGNHEFYHGTIESTDLVIDNDIRDNVKIINNKSVEIDGVKMLFTCLWSHVSKKNESAVKWGMNDFRYIRHKGNTLTIETFNELHKKSMMFLSKELTSNKLSKTVVVSHHVPTIECIPVEFKTSDLNEGFTVNLENFIKEHDIDYWIYGHSHRNSDTVTIGKTQIVCNQFGYANRNEHKSFKLDKIIKL